MGLEAGRVAGLRDCEGVVGVGLEAGRVAGLRGCEGVIEQG